MPLTRFAPRIKGNLRPIGVGLPTVRFTILSETQMTVTIGVVTTVRRRSPLGPYGAPMRRPSLAASGIPEPVTDFQGAGDLLRKEHVWTGTGTNTPPATSLQLVVEIREGATVRATRTLSFDPTDTTLTPNVINLTSGELASIGNLANLSVRFTPTGPQRMKISNLQWFYPP